MMADIDFNSEKYRKPFGGARFTVSALACVAKMKTYPGKLHIVKEGEVTETVIEGPFITVIGR